MYRWQYNQNREKPLQTLFPERYVVGGPFPTSVYTTEELKNMGFIGVYEKIDKPSKSPIFDVEELPK
jgi:hypothetical protein